MTLRYEHFSDEKLPETVEKEISTLRADCFPEVTGAPSGTDQYWKWKFYGKPDMESATIALAREEAGPLLGYYSCIDLSYRSRTKVHKVGLVVEVMTSPRARGKGVFTALGFDATDFMLRNRGYELLTGYPIREAVLPGHRKVGWAFLEKMPVRALVCSRILGFFYFLLSRLLGCRSDRSDPSSLVDLNGWQEFENQWRTQFADPKDLFYLDRSEAFTKWRYSAPGLKYQALVCRNRSGAVVGYITFREMSLKGLPSVAVMDLRILSVGALLSLLGKVPYVVSWKAWLIAGMFSREFVSINKIARCGFFPIPQKFQLIVKGAETARNYFISWLDTDDV